MVFFSIIKPIALTLSKEFVSAIILLVTLSLFIFSLLQFAPGEELLQLSSNHTQNIENPQLQTKRGNSSMSLITDYFQWLANCLTGNFGISSNNGLPVWDQSLAYIKNSCLLIFLSLFLAISISIPLSIFKVTNKYTYFEKPLSILINLFSVLPLFWVAYLFIYLSGSWFNHFPIYLTDQDINWQHILLPILLLAIGSGVVVEMLTHLSAELKRTLAQEYILYARAKGASVAIHALKEGIIFPLLTLLSNRIAYLFSATIIVEQVFNWPGIGRLLWQAAQDRDMPLLMGAVLLTALIIRTVHFFSRSLYILLNPRASHE